MGVYSDYAEKYFDWGIPTIPCEEKRPIVGKGWEKFCETPPTNDEVSQWAGKFQKSNQLGLLLGRGSGLVALDFDYEWSEKSILTKAKFEKDLKSVELQILSLLPGTPCIKKGKKGWTRIFKYHDSLEKRPNMAIDRNGVRLFDFLGWHKQTIIPPSIYSRDINYRWIGPSIEECLDDIPEITLDTVVRLANEFGDVKQEEDSRHLRVFKFIKGILAVEKDHIKVAKEAVEYDLKENSPPYLSDKKHNQSDFAIVNATAFVAKISKWLAGRESLGLPKEQAEPFSWDYFFRNSFKVTRKDIISKNSFAKLEPNGEWFLMSAVEGVLRSYAQKAGLNSSRTVDEFERWNLENTNHDFLCDIPDWDGVDRVSLFGNAIKSPNFTGSEISEILKHWGSNIFRRVESSNNQNRCIILKGDQGLGKDYLVRSMLKDFAPYYESTTLPGTQKDALEIVSRLLAVHIEEFDQTKHLDIAFLKSLITQPSSFFRESYGAAPNQKIMRPSFISTANVDDILRDPTGNRRFIVIPVSGIEWGYPENESLQVMAQFRHLFAHGEAVRLSPELELKIKGILDEFTPEDLSVAILELYRGRLSDVLANRGDDSVGWAGFRSSRILRGAQAVEVFTKIAKDLGCSLRKVQMTVKASGCSARTRNGVFYFAFPEDTLAYKARALSQSTCSIDDGSSLKIVHGKE